MVVRDACALSRSTSDDKVEEDEKHREYFANAIDSNMRHCFLTSNTELHISLAVVGAGFSALFEI